MIDHQSFKRSWFYSHQWLSINEKISSKPWFNPLKQDYIYVRARRANFQTTNNHNFVKKVRKN
jgi:hypothetical protein